MTKVQEKTEVLARKQFATGDRVRIRGCIKRVIGDGRPVSKHMVAIGEQPECLYYAYWVKYPYWTRESAVVLGWTYKLAGKVWPNETYHGSEGLEYEEGGIHVDCTGLAWIVMPLHLTAPNRYRVPVVTINEYMEPQEQESDNV